MPRPKKDKPSEDIGQVYGYLRVSTEGQNLDNNKDVIQKKKEDLGLLGNIEWVEEKVSGVIHWKERQLGEVYKKLKQGDILIMSELSRISRNALEIAEFISAANQKGAKIYSLDIKIPGRDGKEMALDGSRESVMYINTLSLGAQMEREYISERTKVALKKRQDSGKTLGRPIGSKNRYLKLHQYEKIIRDSISRGVTLKRLSDDYKVSPQTMCNFVKARGLNPNRNNKDIKDDTKSDKVDELKTDKECV